MIGACSILRKKTGDSDEKFYDHWLNVHGPLAADLHGVRRYLQSHFVNSSDQTNDLAREFAVNGLAEIWFDSEADRQICYDSEQEEICDVDSLLFIGATARVVTAVTAHILPTGKPAPRKQVFLFIGSDAAKVPIDFDQITRLSGVCGLTDHLVTQAGAEPTQKRERVDIDVSRIVAIGAEDAASMRAARSLVPDRADIAVFDCVEHYLV